MSPLTDRDADILEGPPRASGDEPHVTDLPYAEHPSAPRERG